MNLLDTTTTFHPSTSKKKTVHSWHDNISVSKSVFFLLLYRCDSDTVLLSASSILLALTQPVHCSRSFSSQSLSLAAHPGIISIRPGDEGEFSSHFHVVDPPAALKVLPLALSAGLLVVALALHCINNPFLGQDPGEYREKVWVTGTLSNRGGPFQWLDFDRINTCFLLHLLTIKEAILFFAHIKRLTPPPPQGLQIFFIRSSYQN